MADAPAWVTRLISPPECPACHQPGAVALHQIVDQSGFLAAGTAGWEALEEIVGGLEGGESVAFASGMAGIAAIFEQLAAEREGTLIQRRSEGVVHAQDRACLPRGGADGVQVTHR